MPSMRVHELAKELNLPSKELLARLAELKIPAKTHASPISDADVEKVRASLDPEIKEAAGIIDDEEAKALAQEKAEAQAKKAEEEAERRAAMEKERAMREEERAKRQSKKGGYSGAKSEEAEKPASEKPKAPAPRSAFASLQAQLEAEAQRLEREKQEAEARKRMEAAAKEVAKKQAVEERLHGGRGKQGAKQQAADKPARKPQPTRLTSQPSGKFNSLLSQIESEKERMAAEKARKKAEQQQQRLLVHFFKHQSERRSGARTHTGAHRSDYAQQHT